MWLMQEARLNVIPETTLKHGIYFELKKRVNAGRLAFGDLAFTGSTASGV